MKRKLKKKKFLKNELLFSSLLVLIILGIVSYLFVFSEFFQIKKIIIRNEKERFQDKIQGLIEGKIEKKLLFFKTKSIFLLNFNEIKDVLLKEIPQIEKVDLKRKFPSDLEVKIKKRTPVAIFIFSFQGREKYFSLDKEGIVFNSFSKKRDKMLKIKNHNLSLKVKLGDKVIEEETLGQILVLKNQIKKNFKISLTEGILVSEQRLNFKTREGWEIYFNLKNDINLALIKLDLILKKIISPEERKNLQYIDLRYSRAYYK